MSIAPRSVSATPVFSRPYPVVRGWMTYYGRFTPAALMPLLKRINGYLVRWARKKYRRLAPFKRPARVTILAEIPKGPTGKVQRRNLAALVDG